MVEIHLAVGVVVMATSVVATVWGAIAYLTRRPSVWFWYVLRAAQFSLVAQVLIGGLLLATDHQAGDDFHYMYGVLALVVSFAAEAMRTGSAQAEVPEGVDFEALDRSTQREIALRIVRRETGIMTIGALVIAAAAVRAAQTSGGLF
jgi:hypothetical protein